MSTKRIIKDGEDITESVKQAVSKLGLSPEIMERCSVLLILQLHVTILSGAENPFKAIHEINYLETDSSESRTKPPTLFKGKILRGLWHKHYEGTGMQFLAMNLLNQLKHNKRVLGASLPDLSARIAENEKTGTKKFFELEDIPEIANEFSIINFQRRADAKIITGHWIIYAIHNEKKYYLTLARHEDLDDKIRSHIDSICLGEFPFLKDILPNKN